MTTFSGSFTQGGQTQLHKLRMIRQVVSATFKASLWIFLICLVLLIYLDHPWQDFWLLGAYAKAWFMTNCPPAIAQMSPLTMIYNRIGTEGLVSDYFIVNDDRIRFWVETIILSFIKKTFQAILIGILGSILISWFWIRQGKSKQAKKVLSGGQIVSSRELSYQIKKQKLNSSIALASVPLVANSETEHTLIVGTTGSGKTNAMNELLMQIKNENGKAVIVDTTGCFVEKFYNPQKDILLNPLDNRSAPWDLWFECEHDYLFDNIAEAMIPQTGNDPFWVNAARSVFATAAKKLNEENNYNIEDLLWITLYGSLKEVAPYFANSSAATMMDPDSEKTAISIRSTLAAAIKPLEYLKKQQQNSFSIREWIQDSSKEGFLFLTATPEQRSSLIPLISAWLSLATKGIMGKKDSQKVWIFVDELSSLNKLPDLTQSLAEVRKYGGCFVLGLQTLSQLDDIYGQNASRIVSGLTGTKLIFRTPDTYTAKRMSEFLGEQEVLEAQESISFGAHQMRDGVSLSDRQHKKPLVDYSELMKLENLTAYLQLPRNFPVAKVTFSYHDLSKAQPAFEAINKDLSVYVNGQKSHQ